MQINQVATDCPPPIPFGALAADSLSSAFRRNNPPTGIPSLSFRHSMPKPSDFVVKHVSVQFYSQKCSSRPVTRPWNKESLCCSSPTECDSILLGETGKPPTLSHHMTATFLLPPLTSHRWTPLRPRYQCHIDMDDDVLMTSVNLPPPASIICRHGTSAFLVFLSTKQSAANFLF